MAALFTVCLLVLLSTICCSSLPNVPSLLTEDDCLGAGIITASSLNGSSLSTRPFPSAAAISAVVMLLELVLWFGGLEVVEDVEVEHGC